jgi:predicted lipoprotein with Yx(FWY)xxD motif
MPSVAAAALVALVVAGCGNGGDGVRATAAASTPSGAAVGVRSGDLGKYLVDGQGRTLYLFEQDKGPMSTCSGACASAWPPAEASGQPKAGAGIDAAKLGSISRSDGGTQLTYADNPLYRYAGDAAPGDTNGQDLDQFGAAWYVVSPAGKKIEDDE